MVATRSDLQRVSNEAANLTGASERKFPSHFPLKRRATLPTGKLKPALEDYVCYPELCDCFPLAICIFDNCVFINF